MRMTGYRVPLPHFMHGGAQALSRDRLPGWGHHADPLLLPHVLLIRFSAKRRRGGLACTRSVPLRPGVSWTAWPRTVSVSVEPVVPSYGKGDPLTASLTVRGRTRTVCGRCLWHGRGRATIRQGEKRTFGAGEACNWNWPLQGE